MPRKKIDVISRLEALSKDQSLPASVREDAGKELLRLTLKDNPPAPAPVRAREDDMSVETFIAALEQAEKEIMARDSARVKPRIDEASESQQFAADQKTKAPETSPTEIPTPPTPPKPQGYVWRDERGFSTEDIKDQMWQEKVAASNAWYASIGGRPSNM